MGRRGVIAITVDVLQPPPADIALREAFEAEGFGEKDPRRFNFRRVWSSGDDDVVAGTDTDNWSAAEFRPGAFVWGNANAGGRGEKASGSSARAAGGTSFR